MICPKCSGQIRVIAFIEEAQVIKKILKCLGLWNMKRRPRHRANAPPIDLLHVYGDPQAPTEDDYLSDQIYPVEACFK